VPVNTNLDLKLIIINLLTQPKHLQPVRQNKDATCHDITVTTVHEITAQYIVSLTECIQTKYLCGPRTVPLQEQCVHTNSVSQCEVLSPLCSTWR
jgi:hypothetical protein